MLEKLRQRIGIKIVREIANVACFDESVLDAICKYASHSESRVVYNASWIISHAVDIDRNILSYKHHRYLLNALGKTEIGGVKRSLIRVWQFIIIPETILPKVTDYALKFLSDPKEDIAVRAFAITVLENCLKSIPELKDEVLFFLERELLFAGPAIQVRAKRFIKAANKHAARIKA